MLIFCVDIRGRDEGRAKCMGRTRARGSAFAASLLAYAAREQWGLESLPVITRNKLGKPVFAGEPDKHFSLSHTKTHVLAAVSNFQVGADVETRVAKPGELIAKLTTGRERLDFEFFELWSLRESYYKLIGEGNLRSLLFKRENGRITAPLGGVNCRVYGDIDGCSAAACSFEADFPEKIIIVPANDICT